MQEQARHNQGTGKEQTRNGEHTMVGKGQKGCRRRLSEHSRRNEDGSRVFRAKSASFASVSLRADVQMYKRMRG